MVSGRYFRKCRKAPHRCWSITATYFIWDVVLEVQQVDCFTVSPLLRSLSHQLFSTLLQPATFGRTPQVQCSPRRLGLLTRDGGGSGGGGDGWLRESGCWWLWDGDRAAHFYVHLSKASDLEGEEEKEVIKRERASAWKVSMVTFVSLCLIWHVSLPLVTLHPACRPAVYSVLVTLPLTLLLVCSFPLSLLYMIWSFHSIFKYSPLSLLSLLLPPSNVATSSSLSPNRFCNSQRPVYHTTLPKNWKSHLKDRDLGSCLSSRIAISQPLHGRLDHPTITQGLQPKTWYEVVYRMHDVVTNTVVTKGHF